MPGRGGGRRAHREILGLFAPGVWRLGVQLLLWRRPDAWAERWLVESRTVTGRRYVVARSAAGAWGCSCPRWIFHRARCWHIERVQAALGASPR
jgi:hypothetical protein